MDTDESPPPPLDSEELEVLVGQAVELAAELGRASGSRGRGDARSAQFAAIVHDEASRRFVGGLADEVVRIRVPKVAVRRFAALVADTGVPAVAGTLDGVAIRLGATVGRLAPGATMSMLRDRLRREVGSVVLDAGDAALARYLRTRRDEHVNTNVNLLGEAVLGDAEADRRAAAVADLVARADVDHVSVKLSGLVSHHDAYAVQHTVAQFRDRLRAILEVAAASDPATVVCLDMEEYRDLSATAEAFARTLSEPGFSDLAAGVALQAYLPDALGVARGLCRWAVRRRQAGGAQIEVRLVKGANLAMERVEAEMRGWPAAPYADKEDVDANFKRVLEALLQPGWGDSVRVGVASHNLFDVAWAITLAEHLGVSDRLEIEMLEGMADAEARAVARRTGSVLLYAPIVHRDDFDAAIAYLVRRLDENTQPENFLAAMFDMRVGDERWEAQEHRFRTSVLNRDQPSTRPRRQQDRSRAEPPIDPTAPFAPSVDTDWVRSVNREWIAGHLAAPHDATSLVGAAGGADVDTTEAIDAAVARGRRGRAVWGSLPSRERQAVLCRVGDVLEAHRGELIAAMVHEGAKTVGEADPEVSEAVDFARWYASSIDTVDAVQADGLRFEPYGLVVVASPWNFPVAIPLGGVTAALAAGSAVILKPAPEAVACARVLAECAWEAGVAPDVLQLVACPDGEVGRHLVCHPGVDAVVLTGSIDTARLFLDWRPGLRLHAETSGKNAMVITESADLDLAVSDLVRSAFGHAGQKCSAASLAILTAGVYEDPRFRRQLADAVSSLRVGPAADPATNMSDLIRPPGEHLRRALTNLEEGEEWLVEPRTLDDSDRRWSPGVRLGVRPGSFFHLTECFGPVLGLMRAPDLDTAIEWQNATPFGLTGGIHSLDRRELERWCDAVEVGNAYVNRATTGAIVERQPFGGWKASSVGPTAKAGGPNQVLSLGRWYRAEVDADGPAEPDVHRAARSFDEWWDREFGQIHDPAGLRGEANVLRYLSLSSVVLRVGPRATEGAVRVAVGAARVAGVDLEVSRAADAGAADAGAVDGVPVVVESEDEFAARVVGIRPSTVRVVGGLGDDARRVLYAAGVRLDDSPVVDHGRIELLRWLHEQSVSVTLHRHGNIDDRFRSCVS